MKDIKIHPIIPTEHVTKILTARWGEYYDKFIGITPHSKREIQAIVYVGNVVGKINPSAEINKARWVKIPEKYNLSDVSKEIIRSLRKTGHL